MCCGYINRRTTADLRAADEGSCTDLVSTSTSGDSSTRHLPTPHLAVVLLLIPEAVDVSFCIQHIRTGNLNPPPAAPQTAQDRSCSLDSDQLCATLIARFPEPNPPICQKVSREKLRIDPRTPRQLARPSTSARTALCLRTSLFSMLLRLVLGGMGRSSPASPWRRGRMLVLSLSRGKPSHHTHGPARDPREACEAVFTTSSGVSNRNSIAIENVHEHPKLSKTGRRDYSQTTVI